MCVSKRLNVFSQKMLSTTYLCHSRSSHHKAEQFVFLWLLPVCHILSLTFKQNFEWNLKITLMISVSILNSPTLYLLSFCFINIYSIKSLHGQCRKRFPFRSWPWSCPDWVNDKMTIACNKLYMTQHPVFPHCCPCRRDDVGLGGFPDSSVRPRITWIFYTSFQALPGLLGLLGNVTPLLGAVRSSLSYTVVTWRPLQSIPILGL